MPLAHYIACMHTMFNVVCPDIHHLHSRTVLISCELLVISSVLNHTSDSTISFLFTAENQNVCVFIIFLWILVLCAMSLWSLMVHTMRHIGGKYVKIKIKKTIRIVSGPMSVVIMWQRVTLNSWYVVSTAHFLLIFRISRREIRITANKNANF